MKQIIKDTRNRTKARKEAERQRDFDTWADRLIVAFIILFPAYLIIRTVMTG